MVRIRNSFQRKLEVREPLCLEVDTGSGDISLSRGEEGILTIDASFDVQARTEEQAHELADRIMADPPIEVMEDRVRIGDLSKYDLKRVLFGWGPFSQWVACDFRITAPARTSANLDSGSGDHQVHGVHGPISADTGSGNVRIEDVEQDVEVDTGSGDITVIHVGGDVSADAGSGNIRVKGVGRAVEIDTGSGNVWIEDAAQNVEVDTGSGDITVIGVGGDVSGDAGSGNVRIENVGRAVEVDTGSGNVTIDSAISPAVRWSVSTGSGDVRMKLPSDSQFSLCADTNSGEFETDLPLIISGKVGERVEGAVGNDPSASIRIEASSGDIRIKVLPSQRVEPRTLS